MSTQPTFIDNRDGNTMQRAITEHLKSVREAGTPVDELWVATAFFNPAGFMLLAEELEQVGHVRLMLGADPTPEAILARRRAAREPGPDNFEKDQVKEAVEDLGQGMAIDRNLLPFDRETEAGIRRVLAFLESRRITVKLYTKAFLHAKAFLFRGDGRGFLAGSANWTRAGLRGNMELDLGHWEDPLVRQVEDWYEDLWDEAKPYDLAALYEALLANYEPYLIYLRVLYELYGADLLKEVEAQSGLPITSFQLHGVWRAERILAQYGGVLIADGVGLGKTFTAGELISRYRKRRQKVMLVCPAALRETWNGFLWDFDMPLRDVVSYEELANDLQLADGSGKRKPKSHLGSELEEYQCIVVDEAHNYRNPDVPTRAAVLRSLMRGQHRDLIMLTATPVNNSLMDLYHLLGFFIRQDAQLSHIGVLSLAKHFSEAQAIDPFDLNPDFLYPVIDAVTVKRTRQFVKEHYSHDQIRIDGVLRPISFPTPVPITLPRYDLESVLPGFIDRLEEALAPEDEEQEPELTLARYQVGKFANVQDDDEQEGTIIGLLKSGLLKRFESSANAFGRTARKMAREHEIFLEGLSQGKVLHKAVLRELGGNEDEIDYEELFASDDTMDAKDYKVGELRDAVENDLAILREFATTAETVRPEIDPKLKVLVAALKQVVAEAAKDGIDADSERQHRKVLIFSFFEDTVEWVVKYLESVIAKDPDLACYRGRIASASGSTGSREDVIYGFAPHSTKAPAGKREDRYDLLVATDVLAEGLNLQQCRNIINYDLPWNPMRMVQRHGRIDRIGSDYSRVFLRTIFPDEALDDLLKLEERIRQKLARAARSVGVESAPIEGAMTGEQTFSETREEIEKLLAENPELFERGGTEKGAQTGEIYRAILRKALADSHRKQEIMGLPWKAGSGMVRGSQTGHFFLAEVGKRVFLRFVPLDPETEIISQIGTCLRMIECEESTPLDLAEELMLSKYDAWDRARKSVFSEWERLTDPANLQPDVPKINREVVEHLRNYPPADTNDTELEDLIARVHAPWSMRDQNILRRARNEGPKDAYDLSAVLKETIVEKIGVEPYVAPTPLSPIHEDEIRLICWMGIEAE